VFTGENWNEVMNLTVAKAGFGATFFFLEIMVMGNLTLLNIFLAILLSEDEDLISSEDLIDEGREDEIRRNNEIIQEAYEG
jgi:hypothetical protein